MSDAGMLRKRSTKLQRGSKVDEVAAEQVRNVSPALSVPGESGVDQRYTFCVIRLDPNDSSAGRFLDRGRSGVETTPPATGSPSASRAAPPFPLFWNSDSVQGGAWSFCGSRPVPRQSYKVITRARCGLAVHLRPLYARPINQCVVSGLYFPCLEALCPR